jgi:hypothetical protein
LDYLAYLSGSKTLPTATIAKAQNELSKTNPASTGASLAVCNTGITLPDIAAITAGSRVTFGAGTQTGKVVWKSLENTVHDACQDINLIAFADFTKGDTNLHFNDGTALSALGNYTANANGISIMGTQFLQYDSGTILGKMPNGTLAGRTIEIGFTSLPTGKNGITNPANTLGNVVLDLNDTLRIYR